MGEKQQFYISDFDFTLSPSTRRLGRPFSEFLTKLEERNVLFTVATARSIHSLSELVGPATFYLPVIESNGGYVTNHATLQPLHIQAIDEAEVRQVQDISRDLDFYPMMSCYNGGQVVYPPVRISDAMHEYLADRLSVGETRFREPQVFEDIQENRVMSMTFMGLKSNVTRIYEELLARNVDLSMHYYQNKYTPEYYWLSLHHRTATKEAAILRLLKILDIDRDEVELVVFGDDVNDKGMFDIADRSVAVGNAKDELKMIADEVIGTNEEMAVMSYIRERELTS